MTEREDVPEAALQDRLRLMVLTQPQADRTLAEVVEQCLAAGATAIQLRDKGATARELYEQGLELGPLVRRYGALFIINDRADVAVALAADGVHLGPDDVPVVAVRKVWPNLLIGYSTDDPAEGRRAAAEGASYLGIGAVYGTSSKAGLADEAIGTDRVAAVMRASGRPAVGIGGITPLNAAAVAATGAGIAVLGAVMNARRPGEAVRRLRAALAG